jgi:tetratricopeptide (TPR) repeat protein
VAAIVLAPVVAFALAAPTVRAADSGFRRHDDALVWWSSTVARMPPGPGVYLTEHDHSLFAAQYERLVAGGRPDIAVANSELCRDRWFLAHLDRALPELHVPYIDDGLRGQLVARLVMDNLRAGRPVAGDQPQAAGLVPLAAVPMGRAYLYGHGDAAAGKTTDTWAPAEPPPRYHGDVGSRVSGLIGAVRAGHEIDVGRLDQAAVALGLGRFDAADLAVLAAAELSPDRPLLYRFIPRTRPVFIHEPWQSQLLGDELAWQARLDPPAAMDAEPAATVDSALGPERRLHALWRGLLSRPVSQQGPHDAALPPEIPAIAALGPEAELATVRVLSAYRRPGQAEALVRDVIDGRGDDHQARLLYGSLLGNRGALAEAEVQFERAARLAEGRAPAPVHAEILARLGLAQVRQGKPDAARASWQRALALDPGRADIASYLGQLDAE